MGFKLNKNLVEGTLKARLESIAEDYMKRLADYARPRIRIATEEWRIEARKMLSTRFPSSKRVRNTSEFPRIVTGVLEKSLHYHQRVTHSKKSVNIYVYRKFEDTTSKRYITRLNSYKYPNDAKHQFAGQFATFAGYQERVYVALAKRMDLVLDNIYGHAQLVMAKRQKR